MLDTYAGEYVYTANICLTRTMGLISKLRSLATHEGTSAEVGRLVAGLAGIGMLPVLGTVSWRVLMYLFRSYTFFSNSAAGQHTVHMQDDTNTPQALLAYIPTVHIRTYYIFDTILHVHCSATSLAHLVVYCV